MSHPKMTGPTHDTFAPTDKFSKLHGGPASAAFRAQAQELMEDRSYSLPVYRAGTAPNGSEKLPQVDGANSGAKAQADAVKEANEAAAKSPTTITEAAAHQISHDQKALQAADGDQVKQVVQMNPTGEGMKALVDRDMSAAVDLANKNPDVAAAADHNKDLGESFHRQLKLARTGFES